jgi:uncharacterized protein YllA (UPF0747 family)
MSESNQKDRRELCAAVASENDSEKLDSLVEELIRALDDRQSQSQVSTQQPTTTSRLSAIK